MVKVKKSDAVALFLALDVATASKWNDMRMNVMLNKLPDVVTAETNIEDPHLKGVMETVLKAITDGVEVEVEAEEAAAGTEGASEAAATTEAPAKPPKAPKPPKAEKPPKAPAVQVPKNVKPGEGSAALAKAKAEASETKEEANEQSEAEAEVTTDDVQTAVLKAAAAPKAEKPPKAPKEPKAPKAAKEPKAPKEKAEEKALEAWQYGAPGVRPAAKNRHYIAGQIYKKHGLSVGITDELVAEMDAIYGRSNPEQTRCDLGRAWHVLNAFVNGPDLPGTPPKAATPAVEEGATEEAEAATEETVTV